MYTECLHEGTTTNLAAQAARSARLAGAGSQCGLGEQVGVGRALDAAAALRIDVVTRRARHTCRAGRLRAKGTGATLGRHPINSVAHPDGVNACHVVHVATDLRHTSVH